MSSGGEAFDVAEYWRLLVKHRFLIGGAFLAALVIGVAVTLLTTPIYTATATIQIERSTANVVDVEEVSPSESAYSAEEFFQTQYGLLKSRSLAERVVESLGLATSDRFIEQMGGQAPSADGGTAAARVNARRDAAVTLIQDNLVVLPVRGSRLVNVSFDSPNPQLSAQIANAIAENFIQSNLDRRFESSAYAREFLEDRIAQTKARLEDTERQLVAYAAAQQIINVSEGDEEGGASQSLVGTNLNALNNALAQATAARVAAEERWRQASGSPVLSLTDVLQNQTIQRLTEERARLDAQYQQNASVYQPDWPAQQQLKAQIDELDSQINTVARSILNSIRGQYVVAANQERALQNRVNALKGDVLDLRSRSIQYNILQRELDTSRSLYEGLLQRYKEVGVTGTLASNNISIVDAAEIPDSPSKPQLLLNLAIAMLLGLGLGVGAAFLIEALDESLGTPEDVEAKLNIPVLGVVPLLDKGQTPAEALADIRSSFSEAYYSLRTALQFSTPDGAPASLLVTSSRPAEGKSTTAYALALNLARLDKKVLLIDGDLRNPSMHRVVGVDNDKGMSNLLSGSDDLRAVSVPTKHQNLDFIACGPLPPNPAELWGGDRFRRVLEQARAEYDHVVIDGPPVLGFADAPLLASAVSGTIFVLEAHGTRRAQAKGALKRLSVRNSRLSGGVLTKFNTKKTQYGGYNYAYDYNYGGESEKKKVARR
ncbi:MAG: polysaccharide biosynthesis tyrosine autokinase [Caulobacterales bacterium]|nr:polysaccharide biosynthesis tyrosine autokinase [Caulobacterales bacterium]